MAVVSIINNRFNIQKALSILVPVLFFCFGMFNLGRDLFGFTTGEYNYAGDLVDTRFNNVILEHNYQYFQGNQDALFNPDFFYPANNVLAGSDAHLSTTPFYVLFRMFGMDMFTAFQVWVFVLFALNFFICLFVLQKTGVALWISALGAYLFAFSLPVASQTFHIQTLCKFPVPLVVFFAYQWYQTYRVKTFVYLMLSFILLFFSSLYFTLLVFIPLTLLLVVLFVYHVRAKLQSKIFTLHINKTLLLHGAIAVLAVLVCLPVALKYMHNSEHVPPVDKAILLARLPVLKSYFIPFAGSFFWHNASVYLQQGMRDPWITNFSFGYITTFLCFGGALFFVRSNKHLAIYLRTLVLFLLLCTNYGGWSPYMVLHKFTGFDHLQAPWRFFMVAMFLYVALLTLVLQQIATKYNGKTWLVMLFMAGSLAESTISQNMMKHTALNEAKQAHKTIGSLIEQNRKPWHKAFVVLPGANNEVSFENALSAMICAYAYGLPTINGYTTMAPQGYCIDWLKPTREQVKAWLQYNGWNNNDVENKVLYIELPKVP